MLTRRTLIAATVLSPALAAAHHGYMRWDEDNPVVIEGWISKDMDGFPHWEVHVRVDGEDWEVDVGDGFQLKRAGLKPDGSDFWIKRDIRVEGLRPVDRKILRILPRRLVLDGDKTYELNVRE